MITPRVKYNKSRARDWVGRLMLLITLVLLTGCGATRRKADQAERQGEYALASSLYGQLYRRTPSRSKELRAYYAWHAAENYRKGRMYQRALSMYRSAERYHYPDSALLLRLGQMLHYTGNHASARTYYERYQVVDPDSYLARTGISGVRRALEQKPTTRSYRIRRASEWNSASSDFAPLYNPSGGELYFTSTRGKLVPTKSDITGDRLADLWHIRRDQNGQWIRRIDTLSGGVNTPADEGVATLSADGNTMYYTYAEQSEQYSRTAQIYQTSKVRERGWQEGKLFDIWRDSVTMAAHPSLTPSGRTLYFVSDIAGGMGGKDIYRVSLEAGSIGTPTPLGQPINTIGDELYPYAASDSLLYFASDGHPGLGGLDLYKARLLPSGAWQVESLPAPINSPHDDFSIAFDPILTTEPGQDELAERGIFATTRDDGRGRPHLYHFELPKKTTLIGGYVMDREGYAIPGAMVRLVGNKGGGEQIVHSREDGSYSLSAQGEVAYVMLASAKGFLNQYASLRTGQADSSEVYQVDFHLASKAGVEVLPNVYYAFDSAEVLPESREALSELLQILRDNPEVKIELSAHADRHGGEEYNDRLSEARARSVVRFLISEGVASDRLRPVGYGWRKPTAVSERQAELYPFLNQGQELTPEYISGLTTQEQAVCDALNRRTEFVVLPPDRQED